MHNCYCVPWQLYINSFDLEGEKCKVEGEKLAE